MEEKLRYAIVNCTEMDADFRLTETDVNGWNLNLNARMERGDDQY